MHAEGQRFESVILHKRFDRGVDKREERAEKSREEKRGGEKKRGREEGV